MSTALQERHEKEQYFFDGPTVEKLSTFVAGFANPCLLCAPSIGAALYSRRRNVVVLDVDERFSDLPRFRHWSIYRPEPIAEIFDLIMVDPPFFSVSLSQLFHAVRMLVKFDLSAKVMIAYLKRREAALMGTFHPFGLKPTGYKPGYKTVQNCDRNEIEFYANFDTGL